MDVCFNRFRQQQQQKQEDTDTSPMNGIYARPGVITRGELEEKRLSPQQLPPRFQQHEKGDQPSAVCYVKNIARSVDETDLRYVFHAFFPSEVTYGMKCCCCGI